MYESLLPKFEK